MAEPQQSYTLERARMFVVLGRVLDSIFDTVEEVGESSEARKWVNDALDEQHHLAEFMCGSVDASLPPALVAAVRRAGGAYVAARALDDTSPEALRDSVMAEADAAEDALRDALRMYELEPRD